MNTNQSGASFPQPIPRYKCPFCADGMISPRDLRRFWSKIDQNGPLPDQANPHYAGLDKCWDWLGGNRDKDGYGRFEYGGAGRGFPAHRVAFTIFNGEIRDGLWVLHRCDRPRCVNPNHLRLGTKLENIADMMVKGRNAKGDRHYKHVHRELALRGSKHPNSKLTERDVLEIISSKETGKVLAHRFGLESRNHPNLIREGKAWRHLIPGTEEHRIYKLSKKAVIKKNKTPPPNKLSDEQVRAIRADPRTLKKIAVDYGICFAGISKIKLRKSYRGVAE